MARSLSAAKVFAASTFNGLSLALSRRGYAAASLGAVSANSGAGGSRAGTAGKFEERAATKEESGASTAWAPDPVTGYYRPANRAAEIDVAELRETVLNHRNPS
ncbi:late embryogenesis abundant protein Lea5 [Malania oleifera]|uniref:late embryogenesis abundant protein Lea5 n=1 Tax=Malania oleifera TaxID=397392 RepID=UPI0025AE2003|nr:late embryogenesis abundant protein Lea5 [Malania oleifera]